MWPLVHTLPPSSISALFYGYLKLKLQYTDQNKVEPDVGFTEDRTRNLQLLRPCTKQLSYCTLAPENNHNSHNNNNNLITLFLYNCNSILLCLQFHYTFTTNPLLLHSHFTPILFLLHFQFTSTNLCSISLPFVSLHSIATLLTVPFAWNHSILTPISVLLSLCIHSTPLPPLLHVHFTFTPPLFPFPLLPAFTSTLLSLHLYSTSTSLPPTPLLLSLDFHFTFTQLLLSLHFHSASSSVSSTSSFHILTGLPCQKNLKSPCPNRFLKEN